MTTPPAHPQSGHTPRMQYIAGVRFGQFEILGPLGAGGMGEVYRARDTRLHREVALKLLPKDFAFDAERVARLTREARVLASLSHPNIAAIYGIEEHAGEMALVLELVDGPTLADELAGGALSVETALAMAHQLADAIETAHARGVVHRDLKPANLKTTPDRKVKVLDFGIAKALADDGAPTAAGTPSIATTRSGVVVGTPGYMSPEQTTGGTVDRRSDVWAFGCVLFEALTGRRAFSGATPSETIVRVLEGEPDWEALPRHVSPELEHLLRRCLRKDPRARFQDVGDVRVEIEELRASRGDVTPGRTVVARHRVRRSVTPWAIAAASALALVVLLVWTARRTPRVAAQPAHLVMPLPPGVILPMDTGHPVLALSPDGSLLVFVGEERGVRRLYRRALADSIAEPIRGTEGAAHPFFSPDGKTIAFFAGPMIKRVALSGGLPFAIHASTTTQVNFGATWVSADSIVISASPNSGLQQASVAGDRPGLMKSWDYVSAERDAPYAWPEALPDGRAVIFADNRADAADQARVSVFRRADRSVRTLVSGGTNPRFASGHLLFVRGTSLFAVPFDPRSLTVSAGEAKALDGLMTETTGAGHFATSDNGTLAFVAGANVLQAQELVWVDRTNTATVILDDGNAFSFPRLSPDGARLAVTSARGANTDVWIWSLTRRTLERLTTRTGEDFGSVWSPDGTRLALSTEIQEDEGPGFAWMSFADHRLEHALRTPGIGNWEMPTSWSPDGKWVAFTRERDGSASDVELMPTSPPYVPIPFAATPATEEAASFSPKGNAIAFVSDGTGRAEVYVQSFPSAGLPVQVSTSGGTEPLWSRDGTELFYREGNAMKAVRFSGPRGLDPNSPRTLFEGRYETVPYGGRQANYDVAADGKFVMIRRKNLPQPTSIHVILNWPAVLLRPANR